MFIPVHVPETRSRRPGPGSGNPQRQVVTFLLTALAVAIVAVISALSEVARTNGAGLPLGKAVLAGVALAGLSAGLGLAAARAIGRRGRI